MGKSGAEAGSVAEEEEADEAVVAELGAAVDADECDSLEAWNPE